MCTERDKKHVQVLCLISHHLGLLIRLQHYHNAIGTMWEENSPSWRISSGIMAKLLKASSAYVSILSSSYLDLLYGFSVQWKSPQIVCSNFPSERGRHTLAVQLLHPQCFSSIHAYMHICIYYMVVHANLLRERQKGILLYARCWRKSATQTAFYTVCCFIKCHHIQAEELNLLLRKPFSSTISFLFVDLFFFFSSFGGNMKVQVVPFVTDTQLMTRKSPWIFNASNIHLLIRFWWAAKIKH